MQKAPARPRSITTILVPTDFSDGAGEALLYAEMLAKKFGARILLVHVIDALSYTVTESLQWENLLAHLRGIVQPMLDKLLRDVEKKGMNATAELVVGVPYDQIAKKAREAKADLIVMGTHGRTGMRHLLLGSVAERVIRLASCPVLTVRGWPV